MAKSMKKLESRTRFFSKWFPTGKVTLNALSAYDGPPAWLFHQFLPHRLKAARKEGMRFACHRLTQTGTVDDKLLKAYHHDRIAAWHREVYAQNIRNGYSDEGAVRYHGHMRAYFVKEFNKAHKKKSQPQPTKGDPSEPGHPDNPRTM